MESALIKAMIDRLKEKFVSYANTFLIGDSGFDDSIMLKREHSLRVLKEADALAEAENIAASHLDLLKIAALFHDYGRFEQFKRFKTFSDPMSCDHGELSANLVLRDKILDFLDAPDLRDTVWAIRNHNKLALPAAPSERALLLGKLVRDADKLDIFPVIFSYMEKPINTVVITGLDKSLALSKKVYESIMRGECSDKKDLVTCADFLVNKYAWACDLNFKHTRKEFLRRGYFERIRDFLPQTKEFADAYNAALKLLDAR